MSKSISPSNASALANGQNILLGLFSENISAQKTAYARLLKIIGDAINNVKKVSGKTVLLNKDLDNPNTVLDELYYRKNLLDIISSAETNPEGLIFKVAKNYLLDQTRSIKLNQACRAIVSLNAQVSNEDKRTWLEKTKADAAEDTDYISEEEKENRSYRLRESISLLKESDKLLMEYTLDGRGPKEIAEKLGTTQNIISIRKNRIQKVLRAMIEEY